MWKELLGGNSRALGNPGVPDCTKGLEVNVRYIRTRTPDELIRLVRSKMAVNVREGDTRTAVNTLTR